ncbi:response regulator [Geomonas subterranea]|uniref:Response regulator n=1 Tax=Geomonas subterranea TaxID=2847989 RepID=A0ABX8LKQ4_9BACT|nr:response regulator [Geomonas subterranea]QXE92282.1 response regulator [Geomonas subterranea]QXM09619.1 response regulator [Geomonas subterranea]
MKYRTALVVDDDVQYLRLLAAIFAGQGLTILTADNGNDALRILSEHSCELMITDLQMPEMDGFELSRLARMLAPDLDVVLCTGVASPRVVRQAAGLGISQVVAKPCRVQDILALLRGENVPQPGSTQAVSVQMPGGLHRTNSNRT